MGAGVRVLEHRLIYQDPRFYAAFPSLVHRPGRELLLAFRRAPERRALGEPTVRHTDPNSYLVLVRSQDGERSLGLRNRLLGGVKEHLLEVRIGT